MKTLRQKQRKILLSLSREAFSRQRKFYLMDIADKFDAWRSDQITDEEITDDLWDYVHGPIKQLSNHQARFDPETKVAIAVAKGVIQESELPQEIKALILDKANAFAEISLDKVYQFRIVLRHTNPPIWRQILVPEGYNFWDLHVAIQDSMGWQDYHLHEFRMRNPNTDKMEVIGIPNPDGFPDDEHKLPGWRVNITDRFLHNDTTADYIYDFGDNWSHSITFEGIQPSDSNSTYPLCIGGERTCPPEDVGGIPGFQEFLIAIADPSHPEHDRYLEWIGGAFDPDAFKPRHICFDDPQQRWNRTFEGAGQPDA